ncbi:MAG: MBL fold metallo-hydrolase [Mycobacterium sp.]
MAIGTGQLNNQSAVRQLKLADVTFTYVVDGAMALPPRQFLPAVPAEYWAEHPDDLDRNGRIPMSAGGLLVERDGQRLLIDTGLGATDDMGFGAVNSGDLLATLGALGLSPDDIDAVAFTHLHPDHTGWSFIDGGDAGWQKTFPNARYILAEAEWAPLVDATPKGAPPQITALAEALRTDSDLTLVGDGDEIWPGVIALVTPGHSAGHTSYLVTTASGQRLVAFGDAFHTPAQLAHTDWPSGPDTHPNEVPAARARLLAELTAPDTLGFAFHFGDQPFGRVVPDAEQGPRWRPEPSDALFPPPRDC